LARGVMIAASAAWHGALTMMVARSRSRSHGMVWFCKSTVYNSRILNGDLD